MLAEPKYRQKWTEDPRNVTWSKDTDKYGYKMLAKMGWSEGKGLGANENGTVTHVKVSKRKINLGLGAATFHDDNWLSHQDEFSALLSKLNQTGQKGEDEEQQKSLQNNVQQSQRKIHYSKFIKSKDLSSKSKNDLACVFGQRSKSSPATPQELSEDEGAKSDASTASCPVTGNKGEQGFVTVKSEMNLQEYFAQRMAAMKARAEAKIAQEIPTVDDIQSTDQDGEKMTKKKKKEKKINSDDQEESANCDDDAKIDGDDRKKKKAKKNRKKSEKEREFEVEESKELDDERNEKLIIEENGSKEENRAAKKMKKSKERTMDDSVARVKFDSVKKSKKKKKSKNDDDEISNIGGKNDFAGEASTTVDNSKQDTRKKRKKRLRENEKKESKSDESKNKENDSLKISMNDGDKDISQNVADNLEKVGRKSKKRRRNEERTEIDDEEVVIKENEAKKKKKSKKKIREN